MSIFEVWFSFGGRIGRKTYWLKGVLPFFLVAFLARSAIEVAVANETLDETSALLGLLLLAYPAFAIYTKRWHDIGRSGRWSLLLLIPLVNLLTFIYLGIEDSEKKANEYGPQPD